MKKKTKPGKANESMGVGARLRNLRLRCHLSMRELAEKAGVSASYISAVESERISPTIVTLRKLLLGLDCDLGLFFSNDASASDGYVFRRERMHAVEDPGRSYAFVLPRRPDIRYEVLDEQLRAGEKPEFEALPSDVAGYVLRGTLQLEIEGESLLTLRTGDAFYIPAGRASRGFCADEGPIRLISIQSPPTY